MTGYQPNIFDTLDETNQKHKAHLEQLSFLPVNPLQEKYGQENPILTAREFQIMHMVLSGLEITDIAAKIFLSTHGVKWRLTQVYWKFGVENRLQLIEKASTTGLQFMSEDLIKHTFHNKVNLQAHNKDIE